MKIENGKEYIFNTTQSDLIMTNNKQIAEIVFNKIKEFGYEPYDIEYGNGYFLFEMGDDSVVHFRVKGVWKHWKFGMWVFADELAPEKLEENKDKPLHMQPKVVSVFAQYDTQIDKFKPTRSDLCWEVDANDWESTLNAPYGFYELEDMLGMMKRHPFMCYYGYCGECKGYYDGSFIIPFIKSESKEYIEQARKAIMTAVFVPYTKFKIFFAKRAKCIKSIELYDFEKENPGWSADYLYQVRVVFNKNSNNKAEIAWLNKWFKKDKYGKFGYYDHVIALDRFRREGLKKPYTYVNSKGE